MASPANTSTESSNDAGQRKMPGVSFQQETEVFPAFANPSEPDILPYELEESLQQQGLNPSDYTPISLPTSRVSFLLPLSPPPAFHGISLEHGSCRAKWTLVCPVPITECLGSETDSNLPFSGSNARGLSPTSFLHPRSYTVRPFPNSAI